MGGVSGFVKMILAMVVVFAAVTGTELVDVVEVADDLTVKAQSYLNGVEVEGDETDLFDDSVDGNEFARPTNKIPTMAYAEDTGAVDASEPAAVESEELEETESVEG